MSAGGPGAWPPAVREWVSKCLAAMTPSNKEAASAELKQVIASAYAKNELWSTDWSKKELESLKQPPLPQLKRKPDPSTEVPVSKKHKKSNPHNVVVPLASDHRLQERAMRFQREHEIERQKHMGIHSSNENYSPHINHGHAPSSSWSSSSGPTSSTRRKFLKSSASYSDPQAPVYDSNVIDWDKYTIAGTSREIYKPYLRITSAPDPTKIRPLHILEKTLKELSRKWRQSPDYVWTCDQFKSLRQDLTVQRIKNKFTVQVYEIHARMALESADLVEYNQCQAVLRDLYALGIEGSHSEFLAYRILYLCYTRDRTELNRFISTLTQEQKRQAYVKQALEVHRALATDNYHKFFLLFLNAHNMGGYILDHILERERINALIIMTKAYQQLPIPFITSELQFESAEQTVSFLHDNAASSWISKPGNNTPTPSTGPLTDTPRLIQRVGTLALEETHIPDEAKVLDCRVAHPSLVECLRTKHARVGIKGSI